MGHEATTSDRPQRADARRNRETIVAAARELFSLHGPTTTMDDIAAGAGVGVGTLYRHFPTKEALLTELIAAKFRTFTEHAERAQQVADPWTGFEGMLRGSLAAMHDDAATREAMMRADDLLWEGVQADKAHLQAASQIVVDRAIADGSLRADFTAHDIGSLLCGITATMHFIDGEAAWQRHLDIMLSGLRAG